MNSNSITSQFFEYVEGIIDSSNGDNSAITHYLDLFASLSTESFYVLDLRQKTILLCFA